MKCSITQEEPGKIVISFFGNQHSSGMELSLAEARYLAGVLNRYLAAGENPPLQVTEIFSPRL